MRASWFSGRPHRLFFIAEHAPQCAGVTVPERGQHTAQGSGATRPVGRLASGSAGRKASARRPCSSGAAASRPKANVAASGPERTSQWRRACGRACVRACASAPECARAHTHRKVLGELVRLARPVLRQRLERRGEVERRLVQVPRHALDVVVLVVVPARALHPGIRQRYVFQG